MSRRWKGKGRAEPVQPEGPGGAEGIVLPLQVTGTGVFDIAYTIELTVGENQQKLSVQVDTGSSDLWITSRSCSSSLCRQTNGHSYDPSGSTNTDTDFKIDYLQGSVSGPVVWDKVELGGYSIENQALAAANSVSNEPLSSLFTGILGLALPLNSIIAENIPPLTTNAPDGAAWASNLFSITPSNLAPAARFLSMALERPGTTAIPSLLGIGRHPAALVPDPSKIHYSTLVAERSGTLFWKVGVRAITVYTNGEKKQVALGRSNSGAVYPSAVLDSGVPLILTTRAIANAIYGAIDIAPAQDGQYYVPCNVPLNLTITLDDRPETPIHPLDLTAEPQGDGRATFCTGLIQAADNVLAVPNSLIGDMILGVPFMRNTYTVMAYAIPDENGTFPVAPPVDDGNGNGNNNGESSRPIRPMLGLLPLTDPAQALDEFNRVRVLNQPIQSGAPPAVGGGMNGHDTVGPKKLSVGLIVLVSLVGFFALCFLLFGIRWFLFRRRFKRDAMRNGGDESAGLGVLALGPATDRKEMGGYMLARRGSRDTGRGRDDEPSEDTLRRLRYESYVKQQTLVGDMGAAKMGSDELGYRNGKPEGDYHDPWDPKTGLGLGKDGGEWGDDTLVATGGAKIGHDVVREISLPSDTDTEPVRDEAAYGQQNHDRDSRHDDRHDDSDGVQERRGTPAHQRVPSVVIPLLLPGHGRTDSEDDVDEFGVVHRGPDNGASMAGVGTAARAGRIDPALRQSVVSAGSVYSTDGRYPNLRRMSGAHDDLR
ncbi:aspartic peptidase domain-containing protein [Collybia nuda]|uniref:Aspartic peptidase domain-containing protein n=1 Tax=Collybia nuda TaxID=64659 RepID=A0A9P5Y5D3_9AGAR|nr:aspartic peptidase domain-containing protein [Collybia nuda]